MNHTENFDFYKTRLKFPVVGVDEVGRGALFGSVVAAAVILDKDTIIEGLTDSKKLTAKKREFLAQKIRKYAYSWSIGRASAEEIDNMNILKATFLAMSRAVEDLPVRPAFVLVDGNQLPTWEYPSQAIVRGDLLINEISAASILAKVVRDQELLELDMIYPGYGLSSNKGYPTRSHLSALECFGPTRLHRKSFDPVNRVLKKK